MLSPFANCQSAPTNDNGKKLGVALVGLGGYSTGQLGPALQETKNCYLAGIVTGTPSKEKVWSILTDFEKYPTWNPFLVSIKGELAKGKKLTNTMMNGKKQLIDRRIHGFSLKV